MSQKRVYLFGNGKAEGNAKGAYRMNSANKFGFLHTYSYLCSKFKA